MDMSCWDTQTDSHVTLVRLVNLGHVSRTDSGDSQEINFYHGIQNTEYGWIVLKVRRHV